VRALRCGSSAGCGNAPGGVAWAGAVGGTMDRSVPHLPAPPTT
jgi:hypothetical protein